MQTQQSAPEVRQWIPLGAACRILEVNEATLRRWADTGRVRSFRTPGGHRRFSRGDVLALLGSDVRQEPVGQRWEELALRRIRRRLQTGRAVLPPVLEALDEQARAKMRLLGHRLLNVANEFLSHPRRRTELLQEACLIGREQAGEMLRQGCSPREVMEVFLLFRNALAGAVQDARGRNGEAESLFLVWRQVNRVADEVLLGLTEALQEGPLGPRPRLQSP